MIKIFIFLLGLAIGSFLNCVIYRLEAGGSFLKGRSFCPHCKHILSFKDLIPIFSFLFLKGRCRYCHQKISLQYPLVEISTAVIFLAIFNFQFFISNQFLNLIYYLIISCFLIIIFVYDLKHYLIPDKVIYPGIAIALIYNFLSSDLPRRLELFFSALGAATFFLVIILISRGKWMGLGDFKLAILMGLVLGWPKILVALFLAFLIGALGGIILIILGKKTMKSEVPFGPFLVAGTFLAIFFGQKIVFCYLNLFLL